MNIFANVGYRGFNGGMVVRLLGSAKWQQERQAPAEQLPLLLPRVAQIRSAKPVNKPVENLSESTVSQIHMGTDVSLTGGQMCPPKEVKNQAKEKIREAMLKVIGERFDAIFTEEFTKEVLKKAASL